MTYLSKSYVYISVYGENFSPTEFSRLLNINPTDYGLKGEKGKYGSTLKECYWKYQLDETDTLDGIEKSLNKLINIFSNKLFIINNFVNINHLQVKCYIVIKSKYNEDNGVVLNRQFIQFLYELKALIEIDIYNY
jgi:hypothetical protein